MYSTKGHIAKLLCCLSLLLTVIGAAVSGCSKKNGAGTGASSRPGGGGSNTIDMTVKVFRSGKGRGDMLMEMIRPIGTSGPMEVTRARDKSIGHRWNRYRAYYIEYHWPTDRDPIVPGVYLKDRLPADKCWPYEIASAESEKYVVLKGGIVIHVYDAPNYDKALEIGLEWLDSEVTARISKYIKDAKLQQLETEKSSRSLR